MRIIVTECFEQGCEIAAGIIADEIRSKQGVRLGLATGSTAQGVYAHLVQAYQQGALDFSGVSSVNLDEYIGLGPEHPQSYRYFMDANLFDYVNIDKANTYVPKGTGDTEENIREFRHHLQKAPIDLQLLGVGVNGHIGFNEPGEALSDSAHVVELDTSTVDANARFFANRSEVPVKAITMGMGEIMRSKKLLLLASGDKKAAALRGLLNSDEINTRNPVTFVKMHPNVIVIVDKKLAGLAGYLY